MDTKLAEITIREILPKLIQARENIDIAIAMSGRLNKTPQDLVDLFKLIAEGINKAHEFNLVLYKTME